MSLPRLLLLSLCGGWLLLTSCSEQPETWTTSTAMEELQNPRDQERTQAAWNHLLQAAEGGDVDAMYSLVFHYSQGKIVPQNQERSGHWLGSAARAGHAKAQADLGLLILASAKTGQASDEQLRQARKFLELAAEQNEPRALDQLGSILASGSASEIQLQQAVDFFERAVAQGHTPAMVHLATFYFTGQGVEKDTDRGLALLRQAAEAGNDKAAFRLSEIYSIGGPVEQDLAQGRLWLEKAAGSGNPDALFRLAEFYLRHHRDDAALVQEALTLLNQQAGDGHAASQHLLGRSYLTAVGGPMNPNMALKWFRLAANQGHPQAMTSLAVLQDTGVEKADPTAVDDLLEKAAKAGDARAHLILYQRYQERTDQKGPLPTPAREHLLAAVEAKVPQALFEMGRRLIVGDGVETDGGEGYRLLRLAGAQGHIPALRMMGEMFRDGGTVKRDPVKALALLEIAAQKGEVEAALQAAMMLEQSDDPEKLAKARIYYGLAAKKKMGAAKSQLARMLLTGRGGDPEPARALQLLEEAHAEGDIQAAFLLAELYDQGQVGIEANLKKAADLYRQAAEQGLDDAAFQLVKLIDREGDAAGGGDEAMRHLQRLARGRYPGALTLLGESQLEGKWTRKDLIAALGTFREGAKREEAGSLYQLGLIYEAGRGVEADPIRAATYYRQAADQQHPGALLNLGVMHLHGYGVGQNYAKARDFLTQAKEAGHPHADQHLRQIP